MEYDWGEVSKCLMWPFPVVEVLPFFDCFRLLFKRLLEPSSLVELNFIGQVRSLYSRIVCGCTFIRVEVKYFIFLQRLAEFFLVFVTVVGIFTSDYKFELLFWLLVGFSWTLGCAVLGELERPDSGKGINLCVLAVEIVCSLTSCHTRLFFNVLHVFFDPMHLVLDLWLLSVVCSAPQDPPLDSLVQS